MTPKKVLILHAPGSNRDGDLAQAIRLAGGEPHIVPLSTLAQGTAHPLDYAMLALPGGFSYGDALGAGRLWALELQTTFDEFLHAFVASGRPVIGICNGFQALVKAGILPGNPHPLPLSRGERGEERPSPIGRRVGDEGKATLTFNAAGHFECRWVTLTPNPTNPSPWLTDLPPIHCPIAHGEGRFLLPDGEYLDSAQIALSYTDENGNLAGGAYPVNPNGSPRDIAGITNAAGNVLGLMPHPEDHIYPYQHPRWTRGHAGGMGIKLFENGLRMA
ncbi:MAG: phosphoribosylformylglycinamidine synthase subunit PurQ [Anaerolineales bacterium]|nr:phosphoribosylformylglycinamidine synthase subunit PurQ [Anaerolineales bacterium]